MLLSPITSGSFSASLLAALPGCKSPASSIYSKSVQGPRPSSVCSNRFFQAKRPTEGDTRPSLSQPISIPVAQPSAFQEHDPIESCRKAPSKAVAIESRDQRSPVSHKLHYSTSAPLLRSPLASQSMYTWSSASPSKEFSFTGNVPKDSTNGSHETYVSFLERMEEDSWKSVSTIRSTYFFDGIGRGGGFLAIPHLASHGNAKTNAICRLLESWLTKKLVEPTISDSIPVLEDTIEGSVQSIENWLKSDPRVWAGIAQASIHVRCGHVFMLDTCCDDETIVHLGADEFYQDYPLFVDVEIKMHHSPSNVTRVHPTEVLIAFQNVVNTDSHQGMGQPPFIHQTLICSPNHTLESPSVLNKRLVDSQADGWAEPHRHQVVEGFDCLL